MTAYYNEHDPFAAAWLRELIRCGQIAPGDVDERSIEDVKPDDLRPYTQCHFFAGIGVWSLALRRAGWDDARPIWTGSCPCQPFSAAGKGNGFADEWHLWPAFFHLIAQCGPSVVLGEQVASKDGLAWLDLVQADLEAARYAFGALDLCAAGFGAPHIRQRSWWVALADSGSPGLPEFGGERIESKGFTPSNASIVLGDPGGEGLSQQLGERGSSSEAACRGTRQAAQRTVSPNALSEPTGASPTNGFWSDVDWLFCTDGKWRPVEPGTFPLVNGAPNRVGTLRGYGNSIAAPVAQGFIEAVMGYLS